MKVNAKACFTLLYPNLLAAEIARLTKEFKSDREFKGGVLTISIPYPEGASHEAHTLGDPGINTVDFGFFAAEKIRRLQNRRQTEEGKNEFASSHSADKEKERYGGCILAHTEDGDEVYLSFSGAPDVVDEAVVYVIAEALGFKVPEGYTNPLVPKARELIQQHIILPDLKKGL